MLLGLLDRYWSDEPVLRLLAFGTTLRAVGASDRAGEFGTLLDEFRRLADTAGRTIHLAPALLAAAHGAIGLREWSTAESLLSSSAQEARITGQQDTLLAVERLLPQVGDRREDPRRVAVSAFRRGDEKRWMEWLKKLL